MATHNKFLLSTIATIGLSTLLVGLIVFAWTEPSSPPPTSIVLTPINISGTPQYKTGALQVGGLNVDYSVNLATLGGNVGIGTTPGAYKLDVSGTVNATGYLLNGSPFTGSTGVFDNIAGGDAMIKFKSYNTSGLVTFNFTGLQQQWIVPVGATSITVDARGAGGGSSGSGSGANGGRVQTTISVTPGETLYIYVGGAGGNYSVVSGGSGGYNGGGGGGNAGGSEPGGGGGGGGASDIRQGGTALANRVVVAAGGGGRGGAGSGSYVGGFGGAGGGTSGSAGTPGSGYGDGAGKEGGGGTQSAGGAGGSSGGSGASAGSTGSVGSGGNGGNGTPSCIPVGGQLCYGSGGSGGGGGYYGGGGGGGSVGVYSFHRNGGGGGGGGSSYSGGTGTTYTAGFQSGNGQIIISYFGDELDWSVGVDRDQLGKFKISKSSSLGTNDFLTIDTDGNVGIGIASPQGKLDVNGAIYQRGAQLHADYVFEPSYKLETIEDHAEYMWENKHLQAVPSIKFDENGKVIIEIGALQKGILEELEKAHIYIQQLNEKVKNLEERVKSLEEKMKE